MWDKKEAPYIMAKGGGLKRYDDKIGDLYDDLQGNKETIEETQEFLNNIYGKEIYYQDRLDYKFAKGGTTKQGYIYIPQEAIDELSYTMDKASKSVSGSDVLSGAYVKSKGKNQSKPKGANDLTKRLLSMTDDKDKTKVILEKDVKEMQKYVSDKLITAFYLGLPNAYDFKGDYSYEGGIITYKLDAAKKQIAETLKNIKANKFEMGLKYPQYDFEKLLGKPIIKDVFGKTFTFKDGSTEKYKYRLWIWKDCVIGQTIGSESSLRGGFTDYMYGKEPALIGGYKSVQTSKASKLESIIEFMAKDKNGFVKDNDVLYNGLGGATFETLDKNKIKYEAGGTIVAADPSAAMDDLNQTYGFESVYEKGGRVGFEGLAKKVAKRYEGKPVKAKYQKEYGKTYSKEEAMEVGRKVAAKVYGQQQANMKKMAEGGSLEGPYYFFVQNNGDDFIMSIEQGYDSKFVERLISGYSKKPLNKKYLSYLTKQDLINYLERDFDYVQEISEEEAMASKEMQSADAERYQVYRYKSNPNELVIFKGEKLAYFNLKDKDYHYVGDIGWEYNMSKRQFIREESDLEALEPSQYPKDLMDYLNREGFAKGGSLMGHGLQVGDKIVEDLGSALKVETKDGGVIHVDLASGYRGKDMPLPFAKGGAVGGMTIPEIAKKFDRTTADVFSQLQVGEAHEMEHTADPKVARKIALDHLAEDLDYYTKLKKIGL